jgi:hypothetical protein
MKKMCINCNVISGYNLGLNFCETVYLDVDMKCKNITWYYATDVLTQHSHRVSTLLPFTEIPSYDSQVTYDTVSVVG